MSQGTHKDSSFTYSLHGWQVGIHTFEAGATIRVHDILEQEVL